MQQKRDIHERIYQYVLAVLEFFRKLPKNQINLNIINQGGRAITSVGANDQEADACQSRRDFISKYAIAKKELKEALYWIRLAGDINKPLGLEFLDLIREGKEILLIISKIIINSKTRKPK